MYVLYIVKKVLMYLKVVCILCSKFIINISSGNLMEVCTQSTIVNKFFFSLFLVKVQT